MKPVKAESSVIPNSDPSVRLVRMWVVGAELLEDTLPVIGWKIGGDENAIPLTFEERVNEIEFISYNGALHLPGEGTFDYTSAREYVRKLGQAK